MNHPTSIKRIETSKISLLRLLLVGMNDPASIKRIETCSAIFSPASRSAVSMNDPASIKRIFGKG